MQTTGGYLIITSLILTLLITLVGGFVTTTFNTDFPTTDNPSSLMPSEPESILDSFTFPSACISFFWSSVTFDHENSPTIISIIYYIIAFMAITGLVLVIRGGS